MTLSEADTRSKLIDPAIHARGWTEDLIRRKETAGAIEIVGGKARKQSKGRVDYTLRVKVNLEAQPAGKPGRCIGRHTVMLSARPRQGSLRAQQGAASCRHGL